jgi:hypothetical protein
MDPGAEGTHGAPRPGTTRRVTVRAHHHQTHNPKFFRALATASARPGDHGVEITLSVLGDDVPDYLDAGDELALWSGHEIGHGTITRRLFLWAETP